MMRWLTLIGLAGLALSTGCTRESVRLALDAQRRADAVQQAVFERQHAALRILLYRDLTARLAADGIALEDQHRETLNAVWNERDLVEFWALQNERARALRLAVVDAQLASRQSVADLLIKQWRTKLERVEQAGAAAAADALFPPRPQGGS